MKLLTEKSKVVSISSAAEKDNFIYNVDYIITNGVLTKVHCNVYEKVEDQEQYAGYMLSESGNQQYVFPDGTNTIPHIMMFQNIVSEIKKGAAE